MDNTFDLKCRPDGIIVENGEKRFSIEKISDGDIWFNAIVPYNCTLVKKNLLFL